jgi:hypothetical protein
MKTEKVELTKQELQDLKFALMVQIKGAQLFGTEKKDLKRIEDLYAKIYVESIK